MPSTVCGIIKGNAGSITTNDLRIMRNDVQDCKDYGMKCDEQTWLGFLDWLNEQIDARSGVKQSGQMEMQQMIREMDQK